MTLTEIEQAILNNRGNRVVMNSALWHLNGLKQEYDWQATKFLRDFCSDGVEKIQLDTTSPLYRYYNFKNQQFGDIERLIRVANAYM
jgi:hypothetical protein